MRNSSSCKAVLHAGGTAHPCTGEHPQPEVHESESGYRWTSYGKVLARPQATITVPTVSVREQHDAEYRARRAANDAALGLGKNATPQQVHEALMRAAR